MPTAFPENPAKTSPVTLEGVFEFSNAPIACVNLSGASDLIQAVDSSFRAVMFEPLKKRLIRQFQLPTLGGGMCVDWSREGRHVAVGGFNGTEIYEVWTGERVAKIQQRINLISRLAWSNDRGTLALATRTIRLWNTASEQYDISLDGHRSAVGALAWSKDDRLLASADERGQVIIWEVASGARLFHLSVCNTVPNGLAWSPDSRYLTIPVMALNEGQKEGFWIFDFQLGKVVAEISTSWITSAAFHPLGGGFGDFLITKGRDEVTIWRYGTWEPLCVIPEKAGNYVRTAITIHPNRGMFCTLDKLDKAIRLWKYDLKALLALTEPCSAELSQAETTSFTASSELLNSGHNKGKFTALLKNVEAATDSQTKGSALEILCKELFLLNKGFKVETNTRTSTEEIDLTIQQWARGVSWLEDHAFYILGECKKWSGKCGKNEYVVFKQKLLNRRGVSTLGFLISWNGFTDTVELEGLRGGPGEPVIGLLTADDLKEIVGKGNLLEVLFRAYDKAVMR